MSATRATIDLDDTEGLIAADRDGLLRAASMAGAQVRATAAAVDEGALDTVRTGERPRSVIWVAGRGTAESAGAMLAATLGGSAAEPIVVAAEAPPWIGPLDVLVVAGDDPGDPTLVAAAATGVRRGARVVVAAPYEGPLRDAAAGRVGAAGAATAGARRVRAVPLPGGGPGHAARRRPGAADGSGRTGRRTGRRGVAQQRRPRVVHQCRQGAGATDVGAQRGAGRRPAATLALARHGAAAMLRIGHRVVAAAGLADALVALRTAGGRASAPRSAMWRAVP